MRAGGFPGNPGGLVVSILKTAGARAPAHQAQGRGRRTWRPTERTAGARMVPPGEGNEARGDGRRGVGVSHSTAEAGELRPRDPVEGRGHRQVAPLEGKTANTPRLGPVSTSRQRIAELARQALAMAVAIAWLPGCQWQPKTAHFWQLKTAHFGEIHLGRSGRSPVDARRAFWAGRRERSDRSPGQNAPRSCAAGGHVTTPSRCCSDAARSQC